MIKLSKLRSEDTDVLVFDVRPKSICIERGTEVKVYLGRITPYVTTDGDEWYRWASRWGYNMGEVHDLETAQRKIEHCAKGMYK